MEKKKLCYSCKDEKPTTEFYTNKTKKDGLSDECKDCVREYGKQRRKKLKEKNKINKTQYRVCPKCGKNKHRSHFHSASTNMDGLSTYCKPCRTEQRTKIQDVKKCIKCGMEFLPKRDDALYCSKRCNVMDWWDNLTEEEKINKAKEYHSNDYKNHKKKRLSAAKKWANENKDIVSKIRRKNYWKNPRKSRISNLEKQKMYAKELKDCYVKNKLAREFNYKQKDVPSELIEIKRMQIKVKRLLKIKNDENTETC